MPGNHAVGAARGVAVLLDELAADVGVQLAVERLDLRPEALDLGLKLFGGHVVLRAPQCAGIGKAQFARALIAQLGQAGIVAAHRLADRVPACPQGCQLLGIAALGHLEVNLVDAQAVVGVRVRTVLSAAIGGVELGGLLRGFGAQGRVYAARAGRCPA